MALKGKIYSIARQHDDLNTNELFQSMIDKSAAQDTIVMDGRNLAAGSIFAEQIHAKAITAEKIDSKAIKADHIDAGSIDVGTLWGDQLILPGENYGGVVINKDGLTMKSTGTAKLDIKLSSASGFNITDGNGNQLIDINPSTGNVKMQVNQMTIGGYSSATTKDIDDIDIGGRNLIRQTELASGYRKVDEGSDEHHTNSAWRYTDYFIPVKGGDTFIVTGASNLGQQPATVFYDYKRTFISGIRDRLPHDNHIFKTPTNARFMRFSFEVKDLDTIKLEKGNKATDWTPAPEDVEAQAKAYAKKEVEDIDIGGRNLVLETSDEATRFSFSGYNGDNYLVSPSLVSEIAQGGTYILSANINELNASGTRFTIMVSFRTSSGDAIQQLYSESIPSGYTGRFVQKINVPKINNFGYAEVHLRNISPGGSSSGSYSRLKFEKGNIATGWTKAPEDTQLDVNKKIYNPVRYIRDWANGSTANASNHWGEIQAIQYSTGENIAKGKPVTSNVTLSNSTRVTDGAISTTYATTSAGYHYAQVDLGQVYYDIESILVSHCYVDGRTYRETKTEVSVDGLNWVPVFDSMIEGEYEETSSGKTFQNTQAKAESLFANQEAMKRLGDSTGKVKINGGNITAGTISSENSYSWIDLDKGHFSFGNKRLVWNGSEMTVNGKISVNNIDGDIPKSKLAGSVQTELNAGSTANTTVSQNKSKWDDVVNKQNADSRLDNMVSAHNLPYAKDIIVYGDSNKYYPVYVRRGDQNLFRTIKIWRTYGERGPNDWHSGSNSSTHKGSLMLTWKGNFGGWGGAEYREFIEENTSSYTTLLADCFRSVHSMAYTFMLRGGGSGGAIYHMASDQSLDEVEIYYNGSSDIVYPSDNANHRITAANPVTVVNSERLEELKLAKSKEVIEADGKATDAKEKTDAWSFNGTTMIDGTSIQTGTLTANKIETGVLKDLKNNTRFDLTNGTFNIGNKFTYDGSTLSVDADSINLKGKVTFTDFNSTLQSTVNSKVTQSDVNSSISDIEIGGRNLALGTSGVSEEFNFPQNGTEFRIAEGDLEELLNGGKYTASVFIDELSSAPSGVTIMLSIRNANGGAFRQMNSSKTFYVGDTGTLSHTFNVDKVADKTGKYGTVHLRVGSGQGAKGLYRNMKLEKGDKATGWTPAPEDVEASIGDVDERAIDAKNKTDSWTYSGETTIDGGAIEADTITATQIVANSITADLLDVDKISALSSELGDVTAGTITSENGNIHIDLNEGFMNVAKGLFKIQGEDIADAKSLGQLEEKIDKEVEDREGFISINNGIVTIGQKDSPTNIQIKNDRISFMQSGTEVAYITEQTMEITHGIFVESAKIGEHKQETLSGGHTVFTWEG